MTTARARPLPGRLRAQAWSAAVLPYLLVVRPALPKWIGELTLRNVRVGAASVAVLGRHGSLSLTVEV